MRTIAVVATLGILAAALPLQAQETKRAPSPVYYGMKNPPKAVKPRAAAQKKKQAKATAKKPRSAAKKKTVKKAAAAKKPPSKRRA
jgi:hypothetical protein